MVELPSGTVTFVFTDLEVSTRLWDSEPDAMQAALARHDVILRDTIEAHGGQVVKGRGDGVHAVFATADGAVRAAIACELAMEAEAWPVSEPLRARIGIHTGVAELREGDYFGSAVNRAARLEAVAHGGQIVCSQATADLARDVVPDDVGFVDLGEHRLRDLSRAERVFQVTASGLQGQFGPLASVDAFPGKLPLQVSSFIGRDRELDRVVDALGDARVVTLTRECHPVDPRGSGTRRLGTRSAVRDPQHPARPLGQPPPVSTRDLHRRGPRPRRDGSGRRRHHPGRHSHLHPAPRHHLTSRGPPRPRPHRAHRPQRHRRHRRDTTELLVDALGRDRLTELQGRGAAMDPDTAVAYTLTHLDAYLRAHGDT